MSQTFSLFTNRKLCWQINLGISFDGHDTLIHLETNKTMLNACCHELVNKINCSICMCQKIYFL